MNDETLESNLKKCIEEIEKLIEERYKLMEDFLPTGDVSAFCQNIHAYTDGQIHAYSTCEQLLKIILLKERQKNEN